MDLSKLEKVNDYLWAVPGVRFYGSESLMAKMDEKSHEQITNVARLPGLVGNAMTMPDAHWGYGFPIGGVAAFDAEIGGIISAGGVGFDISCGIRCLRTNLMWSDLNPHRQELSDLLYHHIPAGVGREGKLKFSPRELDHVLFGGAEWAVKQGFGLQQDLEFVEQRGKMAGAVPDNVSDLAKKAVMLRNGNIGFWGIIIQKCRWWIKFMIKLPPMHLA